MTTENAAVTIRPSTAEDSAAIEQLARDAWIATYQGLIPPASRDEHLRRAYNADWLRKLHARPEVRGFLALEGQRPVGFAMMSLGTPADDPPGAVLRSLYLLPETQSKGYGQHLLAAVVGAAREAGIPILWVAVHEGLTAARRWYEKQGFVYDGPADTTIGQERVRQAVYKMNVSPA